MSHGFDAVVAKKKTVYDSMCVWLTFCSVDGIAVGWVTFLRAPHSDGVNFCYSSFVVVRQSTAACWRRGWSLTEG